MPVYEARPASGANAPIVLAISEVWGVHEWVKDVTRRFAKAGLLLRGARSCSSARAASGSSPTSRTS